jgi:hypothetical protein
MSNARIQVIHSSANPAIEMVEVCLDDALLLDNFAFRTVSTFIVAPACRNSRLLEKGSIARMPMILCGCKIILLKRTQLMFSLLMVL